MTITEQPTGEPDWKAALKTKSQQAYQVIGSILSDLGIDLGHPQAERVLDYFSDETKVDEEFLPWPSFENPSAITEQLVEAREPASELPDETVKKAKELSHALRYADQDLDHGNAAKVKALCWEAHEFLSTLTADAIERLTRERDELARNSANAIESLNKLVGVVQAERDELAKVLLAEKDRIELAYKRCEKAEADRDEWAERFYQASELAQDHASAEHHYHEQAEQLERERDEARRALEEIERCCRTNPDPRFIFKIAMDALRDLTAVQEDKR